MDAFCCYIDWKYFRVTPEFIHADVNGSMHITSSVQRLNIQGTVVGEVWVNIMSKPFKEVFGVFRWSVDMVRGFRICASCLWSADSGVP